MSSSTSGSTPGTNSSPHQDRLTSFCRAKGVRSPNYQIVSDRRGGRTAWSARVTVQGTEVQARFWYDGQFVNNAREDAAERALQVFGVLPTPPQPQNSPLRPQGPQSQYTAQQQQQQQLQSPPQSPSDRQSSYYDSINR